MLTRLRTREDGFGLIELLVSMTILNIAILALMTSFNSGAMAIKSASRSATASVVADRQMELYRGSRYTQIGLVSSLVTTANTDPLYSANWPAGTPVTDASCTDTAKPECQPSPTPAKGPDGRVYRIDTYIVLTNFGNSQMRPVKQVLVIVRNGDNPNQVLVRQTSTFDESLGE